MAPSINNPGGVKNADDEIRDAVVSDATKFPGGNIDLAVSEAGAPVRIAGRFQLTNANFLNSFDVSSQELSPSGVTLKPDGSSMYIIGSVSDTVFQYSLSTAFDVTTASLASSFDVSSQDPAPSGVTFKPDGSSMYIIGVGSNSIFQYSLSTAFDVTTASLTSSFDVSSQATIPTGVTFKPDGSSMYVIDSGNETVFQYSLSTAFDVTTASFTSSFNVSSQATGPQGVTFKPDGSSMYVVGDSSDSVFQYSLSTAFDVTTASLTNSFDVSSQAPAPSGVTFKPDGSLMYVIGKNRENVDQYLVGTIGPDPL
jgi:sugar lactone lactonase YvrE